MKKQLANQKLKYYKISKTTKFSVYFVSNEKKISLNFQFNDRYFVSFFSYFYYCLNLKNKLALTI